MFNNMKDILSYDITLNMTITLFKIDPTMFNFIIL